MKERHGDRIFATCGVAFVVLQLGAFALGGSTHQLTIAATAAEITQALSKPASTLSWAGAYLNLLSIGAFLAFTGWACSQLGGGLLGQIARMGGAAYVALTTASFAVMDTIAYRAGHGIDLQLARALITVNEALFVTSWFLFAFFLLAVGLMALGSAHRALGWSAITIGMYSLLAVVSVNQLGQFSVLLWFGWIFAASITLGRQKLASTHRFADTPQLA